MYYYYGQTLIAFLLHHEVLGMSVGVKPRQTNSHIFYHKFDWC